MDKQSTVQDYRIAAETIEGKREVTVGMSTIIETVASLGQLEAVKFVRALGLAGTLGIACAMVDIMKGTK